MVLVCCHHNYIANIYNVRFDEDNLRDTFFV